MALVRVWREVIGERRRGAILCLDEVFKFAFSEAAKGRYFAMVVPVPILHSFLDESTDQTQRDIFCVAAFLSAVPHWKGIQEAWVKRLNEDEISYFRSTECKAVRGAFQKLRDIHKSFAAAKQVADKIRADLEEILRSSKWIGFSLGIVIPDYEKVLKSYAVARRFYAPNPTVAAYSQMMYEVARSVRRKAKNHGVAYVIDDSTYSEKIVYAFKAMKINHPTVGLAAKTIGPLSDKECPPLQMADLLASMTKDMFLKWFKDGGRYAPLDDKWYSHFERIGRWDEEHMLRSLTTTLKNPRLAKGTLAWSPVPVRKISKRERKRMRRALLKKESK